MVKQRRNLEYFLERLDRETFELLVSLGFLIEWTTPQSQWRKQVQ